MANFETYSGNNSRRKFNNSRGNSKDAGDFSRNNLAQKWAFSDELLRDLSEISDARRNVLEDAAGKIANYLFANSAENRAEKPEISEIESAREKSADDFAAKISQILNLADGRTSADETSLEKSADAISPLAGATLMATPLSVLPIANTLETVFLDDENSAKKVVKK